MCGCYISEKVRILKIAFIKPNQRYKTWSVPLATINFISVSRFVLKNATVIKNFVKGVNFTIDLWREQHIGFYWIGGFHDGFFISPRRICNRTDDKLPPYTLYLLLSFLYDAISIKCNIVLCTFRYKLIQDVIYKRNAYQNS